MWLGWCSQWDSGEIWSRVEGMSKKQSSPYTALKISPRDYFLFDLFDARPNHLIWQSHERQIILKGISSAPLFRHRIYQVMCLLHHSEEPCLQLGCINIERQPQKYKLKIKT